MRALDLFAGAGGWDIAARHLGWSVDRAENWAPANATATAAGFHTVHEDVTTFHTAPGTYDVLIASPPCQTYSMAGNGEGRRNLDRVLSAVHGVHDLSDLDARTALVLEPLRIALEGEPVYIAWEQVPAVLPIWDACAVVLRERGYSVVTGVLNAEQHGVPQTRRRAVLMARRDGREVQLPTPTHSLYHLRNPERLDGGVKPWVSMAEAMGWGMTERPGVTVCAGGTDTGGAEPFGHGARNGILREQAAGRWTWAENGPTDWPSARPATSVMGDPRIGAPGHRDRSPDGERHHERSIRVTASEAAILQTFPASYPFQGNKGEVHKQIGNAVPPLLAEAILSTLTQ